MPFVTAGDPDLDFTGDLVRALANSGCDLIEIGFPYSDPIADGPVIQSSYTRALDHHTSVDDILDAIAAISPTVSVPLVAMVSYAIVFRRGLKSFVADARAAGFSGLIVPDLLVEEAEDLRDVCRQANVSLIQLVTPTTPFERAVQIGESSTGFLYYVSVTGITGERTQLPPDLLANVSRLREAIDVPVCIGFGISRPEHVRLLAPVADGLIVGSALVRQVAQAKQRPRSEVLGEIVRQVKSLIAAADEPSRGPDRGDTPGSA